MLAVQQHTLHIPKQTLHAQILNEVEEKLYSLSYLLKQKQVFYFISLDNQVPVLKWIIKVIFWRQRF